MGDLDKVDEAALQAIIQILSPEYMWEAARQCGGGDVIRGAPDAAIEARKIIRVIMRGVRERGKRDLEMALLMRALGWPVWQSFKHKDWKLLPVEDEGWRKLAMAFWPNGTAIPGGFYAEVGTATFDEVYRATIRATSSMLMEHPELNRAVLDQRVWQRRDPYVMVHYEVRHDLRSMTMNPENRSDEWVKKKLSRGLKAAVKFSKSDMGAVATDLMCQWAKYGFLGSSAGAMLSGSPKTPMGWGALVPANGIPLVICVNKVMDKKSFIGVTPDHRALDGSHAGTIGDYLSVEITRLLMEE